MGRSSYDPKNELSTANYGLRHSRPDQTPSGLTASEMIGRTISGKYKLVRCIGQGGMGTIYEAEHALIGNRVAVKMLHENFATRREPVQRLYREARATGSIGHPNIITVHDVGESEDGIPYLVMELLKGQSLGELIQREGRLGLNFVLEMSIQILSALSAAHESGVIHRDLKSDNVFLTQNDDNVLQVKLLDFGISKFSAPDQEFFKLTQTGSVLGTPYYMSPEQAAGRRDLDHRIDIYATGVILHEVLVGKLPHLASNYNALINEIINREIQAFRWQRPELPPRFEKAVLKALSRDRDDRWLRAIDFMEELVTIRDQLSGMTLVESTVPPPDPVPWDDIEFDTQNLRESRMRVEHGDTPMEFETDGPMHGSARMALWLTMTAIPLAIVVAAFFFFVRQPTTLVESDESVDQAMIVPIPSPDGLLAAPVPAAVWLEVVREPRQARVRLGDQLVGEGGVAIPIGPEPVELVGEADGFVSKTFEFVPIGDGRIEIKLEPVPRPLEDSSKASTSGSKVRKRAGRSMRGKFKRALTEKKSADESSPSLDRPMDNPF